MTRAIGAAGGTGAGLSARCAGPMGTRPPQLGAPRIGERTGRVRERGRAGSGDRTRCIRDRTRCIRDRTRSAHQPRTIG